LSVSRRHFLKAGTAALIGLSRKGEQRIDGSFVNDSFALGHLLRDRASFPPPRRTEKQTVVIVGGGIAGLSAAWRLQKRGFRDFVLLEMNSEAGGNARSGRNDVSAYPWAAHYVPVPGPKATYARELFEDLGVLKNGVWEERYLCFSPQERLFLYGRWQDSIEPAVGRTDADREQFSRFGDVMATHRASGEFTIPVDRGLSSKTSGLDGISFADWLAQNRFHSRLLNWYANYACRDDYGALARDTSAWAGIHYFASREAEEKGPLTWPEGNGWITNRLLERLGSHVRVNQMVHRVAQTAKGVTVSAGDTDYKADFVIFAAPTFVAPYVVENFPRLSGFVYSPWLTANLTLQRLPDARGAEPTWDTVFLESPTLGYVDATHQSLRSYIDRTVWTFYWALADGTPSENRRILLERDWNDWKEAILHDLERVHRDIRQCVSRIDIMRMGHAMVRPVVGTIFSEDRRRWKEAFGRIYLANSDLTGISIFEEAQHRGVRAAERVLDRMALHAARS